MGEEKKIGDWVVINDRAYQIKSAPEVFLSNEFATQEQIDFEKSLEHNE
jgi:hypothetical protein